MKPSSNRTLLAAAVVTILSAETAFAQLEEVIVTAERREASLQDTPISIEALNEQQLQERGINNNLDLLTQVAGVQGYGSPQGGSSTAFAIRGIGDGAPQISLDPATARYVDGVYIGKNQGSSIDVIDLARIEILKGPQGTLSGRNSTAGAINYISRAPGDEFGMTLRGSTGNYGLANMSGRVDLPITDSFRASASYFSRSRDPFWDNTNPAIDGFNSIDRDGYRVALQWDASDRLSMDFSYAESNVNNELDNHSVVSGLNPNYPGAAGFLAMGGSPLAVPINSTSRLELVGQLAGGLEQALPFFAQAPFLPALQQYIGWANDYIAWGTDVLANADTNPETGSSDVQSFASVTNEATTFRLNYELTDNVEFRYIYGDREMNDYSVSDLDGMDNSVASGVQSDLTLLTIGGALFHGLGFAPGGIVPNQICLQQAPDGSCAFLLPIADAAAEDLNLALSMIGAINANGAGGVFDTLLTNEYQQTSHEIQLLGSSDDLDWAIGAYFWEDDGMMRNIQNPTYALASSSSRGFDVGGEAFSVFGEATMRTSDKWSFTAGLRYTEEDKYMTYRWRDFAAGGVSAYVGAAIQEAVALATQQAVINIPRDLTAGYVGSMADITMIPETAGIYGNENKQSFDNISGRLVAQYNINDNANAYASYTTGYRAGGFNGGAFDRATMSGDAYGEETMTSMEVGFKSTLMDGNLRLNASLYSYTYDDVQVSTVKSDEGGISTEVENAAKLGAEGLEVELAWALSERLRMTGNYAYIDRSYDVFPPYLGLSITPTNGITPENAFYLAFDFNVMTRGMSSLDFQLAANYQDSTVSIGSAPSLYSAAGAPDIPVNFQQAVNQARTLIDTRLTWSQEMESGRSMSVSLWGKNITDESYRTFGYNFGADLGLPVHQWGNPSTYGLDVTINL